MWPVAIVAVDEGIEAGLMLGQADDIAGVYAQGKLLDKVPRGGRAASTRAIDQLRAIVAGLCGTGRAHVPAPRHDDDRHALRPHLFQGSQSDLSQVFAGQNVGVTQVGDRIWLVTFMQHDLDYFDDETCRLEPIENPFGPKVLPM